MSTDFRLRSVGRRPDSFDDDGPAPWRRRSATSPMRSPFLSRRKQAQKKTPLQRGASYGSDAGQVSDEEENVRTSTPRWRALRKKSSARHRSPFLRDRNGSYGNTTPDRLASRGSWQSDDSDDSLSERKQSERQDRLLTAGLGRSTNSNFHTTTTTTTTRAQARDGESGTLSTSRDSNHRTNLPPPVMNTAKLAEPHSPVPSRRRANSTDFKVNSSPVVTSRRRANSRDFDINSLPSTSSRKQADSKEHIRSKPSFRMPRNRPEAAIIASSSPLRPENPTSARAPNPRVSFDEMQDQQKPLPDDRESDAGVCEEDGWAAETSASDENVAKVAPTPPPMDDDAKSTQKSENDRKLEKPRKIYKVSPTSAVGRTPDNRSADGSNQQQKFDESSYMTPTTKMRKHAPTALDLYGLGSSADDEEEDSMSFLPSALTPELHVTKGSINQRSASAPSSILDSPSVSSLSSNQFDDSFSAFVQSANQSSEGLLEKALSKDEDAPLTPEDYVTKDEELKVVFNYAMEHRIFMKAALELLGELGPDKAVDLDSIHMLKAGPLKKASHLVRGVWKVKYVEIRKGMFSYYEDAMSKDVSPSETVQDPEDGEQLVRKNIPLHASSCLCRPVKVNHKAMKMPLGAGAIFELTVDGGPRRFWMASSRDERQAWIRAILDATMGKSAVSRGDDQDQSGVVGHKGRRPNTVNAKSPFKKDLEKYLRIQKEIRNATDKDMYVDALSKMGIGMSLKVPVIWIEQNSMFEDPDKVFKEEGVSSSVDQLWKDLFRDTVRVNGELFEGGSGHAPERIVGALTNEILAYDRSSTQNAAVGYGKRTKNAITEVQALAYARDVLLSGNRTRSGGDSYYCVDALCRNPDLVVATPRSAEAEPLQVKVSHILPDTPSVRNLVSYSLNDRSGWLRTRNKPHKPWKRRYFVLSEGTLSHYEKASPRPHGLRGQIKLSDAQLHASQRKEDRRVPFTPRGSRRRLLAEDTEEALVEPQVIKGHFIIAIASRDGLHDRQLLFEDETKFLTWAQSFEGCLKILNQRNLQRHRSAPNSPVATRARAVSPSRLDPGGSKGMRFRMQRLRDELGITDQAERGVLLTGKGALLQHAGILGYEKKELAARLRVISNQIAGGNGQATVKVTVQASTTYNICTLDPQGDEAEDIWAVVKANFMQSFKVSGGPNGKMIRGEEVVQVSIVKCVKVSEFYAATNNQKKTRLPLPRKLRARSISAPTHGLDMFQQQPPP